jgi:hypothetical protein
MRPRRAPLIIAVSGPDGCGKSSLVADLIAALRMRGLAATTAYCYGCVICRRFGALGPTAAGRPGRREPTGISSRLSRPHALVDAAELTGRLLAARFRARVAARRRYAAVVTDRGPLDGLAKFDPAPGSWPAVLLTRINRSYDLTLLLDARPDILATRDGEHTAVQLNDLRSRYQRWERRLPGVAYLGTEVRPERVASEALRLVLGDGPFHSYQTRQRGAWKEERHAD